MARRKKKGEVVCFFGNDQTLRQGEVIPRRDYNGDFMSRTHPHPISGDPMLHLLVVEGPDVGVIYWILADRADDVLGVMSRIV